MKAALRTLAGRVSIRNPVPPRRLWPLSGSFVGSAQRDLRLLIQEAGLRPSDRVLDVGCGLGRMAVALKGYLDRDGRYEGFDVRADAIRWARRRVARRDPRIRFQRIDIFSRAYNRSGSVRPADLRFPYDDGSFDVVLLFSVFTHLVTEDMRRYLGEIVRVLESGGRCVATFRLMDEPAVVKTADATYDFRHDLGEFFTTDPAIPEKAIAYREAFVREAYAAAGLEITNIRYGRPLPGTGYARGQDMVIATKR